MGTFLLLLLAGGVVYFGSCVVHPLGPCRACKGRDGPRLHGWLFKRSFRFCHVCVGRGTPGRQPRTGTKALVALGLMKNPERAGSLGWRRRNRRENR